MPRAPMMEVIVEKLSPVLMELEVKVPASEVQGEVEKEYARVQKSARVRGFRPGKAPRHVLQHLYGGAIHQDVAKRIADRSLPRALSEHKVEPITQPSVVLGELSPADAFTFKARFEVRPEIESVKWEGLTAKRPKTEVTDGMLEPELETLRVEHSTLQPPAEERGAKSGDVLSITFVLEIEGKDSAEPPQDLEVELGKTQLLPELAAGLEGMKPEENRTVELTFPSQHPSAELRNKKATFSITLKDLKERILPALDDDFAKDCGEYADLEALKASIRERLAAEQKRKGDDAVAEQLVLALCQANPIAVPPSLVEQQREFSEREILALSRRQGGPSTITPEMRQRLRLDSEVKVRAGLVMAEIAKAREIKVTDVDMENAYVELAGESGKNVAKVKAEYRDQKKREMLIGMILEDKILDLIEGAATITDA